MATPQRSALAGRTIVVTRPAGQADTLVRAIEAAGGRALRFPVLEIRPADDPAPLAAAAQRLADYAFACFVSPNAVEQALPVLLARAPWPAGLRAVTVGTSSERALAGFGIADVIAPRERFDSEALLALPELGRGAVQGRRVVIFRGDGGRELLGDTLRERGATVDYVTCYHRGRPPLDAAPLLALARQGGIDALTVTSSEGLQNLADMVGEAGWRSLAPLPVFVPHARIGDRARSLGCTTVVETGPADAGLLAGLESFFAGPGRRQDATT